MARPLFRAARAPAWLPIFDNSNILLSSMQNLLRQYKASVFQALGHPTRIAIVELLRNSELSAGVLQERLGIEQANVSQHLSVLRNRQILSNRKVGNQVLYSVRNPVLIEVLDIMRRYFQTNLKEAVQMLGEIKAEGKTKGTGAARV